MAASDAVGATAPSAQQRKKVNKVKKREKNEEKPDDDVILIGSKPKKSYEQFNKTKDRLKALDLRMSRNLQIVPKTGSAPLLLQTISTFLKSNGFDATERVFAQEQHAKLKINAGEALKGKTHLGKNLPDLVDVFEKWLQASTPVIKDEKAAVKLSKSVSAETSDSESDSESDSDAPITPAKEAKKPSKITKSANGKAILSQDRSSTESDRKLREPVSNNALKTSSAAKATAGNSLKDRKQKPSPNAPASKPRSESSSVSESDSDSSSEASSGSSSDASSGSISDASSDSASSNKEASAKKHKVNTTAPKVQDLHSDSSSDSSSGSASESGGASLKPSMPQANGKIVTKTSGVLKTTGKAAGSSSTPESSTEDSNAAKKKHKRKRERSSQEPATSPPSAVEPTNKYPKKNHVPFQRIPSDVKIDPRFSSNAYRSYDYAERAHQDLSVTRGKGFTKEKNKKKRGSYRGGFIDVSGGKGIKFDD